MSKKKTKKNIYIAIGAVLIAIIAFIAFKDTSVASPYDEFAQCLTDKGYKMYGAYWCPHCQDQEERFGSSWKNIDYVECSLPNRAGQTIACKQAGIQSYPTWETGEGERISGAQTLERLAQLSGCSLPTEEEMITE